MDTPLISIVLCTYNGEAFLEQQISSLVSQTYPNLEIIISDDSSTDGTKAILSRYEGHKNIRIVYNEQNAGFVKNFEQAVLLTAGEYIAFSDQDDIWLPGKIEKLYHAITDRSLIYSDSILVDDNGQSLRKKLSDFKRMRDNITDSRGFIFLNVVSGHTMMIKKDLIAAALPLPGGFYHDWWFAIQAANKDGIAFLNEPLTLYRQHSQTITKTIIKKRAPARNFSEKHQAFLRDLAWLELLKNNKSEQNTEFYDKLYNLFLLKQDRSFTWPLFYFLLKHEKILFQFSNKSYLSKLVRMRKMARGERSK